MIKFLIYAVLFTLAIPWYWSDSEQVIVFGLPLWASASIFVSFLISCYTAYLLLRQKWPGE